MRGLVILLLLWPVFTLFAYAQPEKNVAGQPIEVVEDAQALETLHEAYLAEDTLQLERPDTEPEEIEIDPPAQMPAWLRSFFEALGPVFKLLFYIGAGLIVAFIAYHILATVFDFRLSDIFGDKNKKHRNGTQDDILHALKPDEAAARTLLEQADALAREGKFAEAVHLLLFRSIEDIQTRREQRLSTALTAREIGKLDDLPAKPRAALGPIIQIVENSFFGGRPVDEPGWQTARKSYEDFAFGEAWS